MSMRTLGASVRKLSVDNDCMVNGISTNNVLNLVQSQVDSGNTRTAIAVSVMKQIQDQQALQGEALVKMIQQSSLDGSGRLVDIRA
jgi:hypothetical protein